MHIFLDESGDLGFDFTSRKPSKFFTITLLVCKDKHSLDTIEIAVYRTIKNKLIPKAKSTDRKPYELKGADALTNIKSYFLKHAYKADSWSIYTIVLDKKVILNKLTHPIDTHRIYNLMANHLLKQVNFSTANTINLFIDKSKNRAGINEFDTLLRVNLDMMLPLNVPLNIRHMCSHQSYGIQAVDLFCWGIFRRYERGDEEWYRKFSDKIVYEQRFTA